MSKENRILTSKIDIKKVKFGSVFICVENAILSFLRPAFPAVILKLRCCCLRSKINPPIETNHA